MSIGLGGLLLGLLVGLRHAIEPDHLAAVSTLVGDAPGARRGALLGAWWGVGHTVALLAVAAALMLLRTTVPEGVAAGLEAAVGVMLVVLGVRAIARAIREGRAGAIATHRHGGTVHAHGGVAAHVHVGGLVLGWRPLVVGLLHGLAGSGALTAAVFARLGGAGSQGAYVALFGVGSIAGMALVSAIAGRVLALMRPEVTRLVGSAAGVVSIVIGVWWSVAAVG